ncbi:MAG: hypothetical protein JWM95_1383 [Gemmatimonadetes bacterium]|nr:hypothetical protein [Gemmatimonadota bacterium]
MEASRDCRLMKLQILGDPAGFYRDELFDAQDGCHGDPHLEIARGESAIARNAVQQW